MRVFVERGHMGLIDVSRQPCVIKRVRDSV